MILFSYNLNNNMQVLIKSYLETSAKSRHCYAYAFHHILQIMSKDITHVQAYHSEHDHHRKHTNWPRVLGFAGFCGHVPTTTSDEQNPKETLVYTIHLQSFINHL